MNKIFSLSIAFPLLFSACVSTSRDASLVSYEKGIPQSQILEERQIIIPSYGGQKITVPTQKTEVGILWTPPKETEELTNHYNLLDNMYLPNNYIGSMGQLEALVANHYLEQLLYKNQTITRNVAKRASHYLPYIIKELEERGLPIELAALPMIESAYISNAVSPAGAAGLWQIMPLTAKELGLKVSSENDERFHFKKSTNAALDYLEKLYKIFNDWPLAISAYNCGIGRLKHALKVSKTNNLLSLLEYCKRPRSLRSPLRAETRRYVPQFIAAAISLKIIGVLPNTTNKTIAKTEKTQQTTTPPIIPLKPLKLQGNYGNHTVTTLQKRTNTQQKNNNQKQTVIFHPTPSNVLPAKMTRAW